LVKKEFAALVQHNPHINQVITFDKSGGNKELKRLKERIKKEHFDWLIDLHNNLRTNYLKMTIRFPEVSSYGKQSFRRHLLVWLGKNLFGEAKQIYLKYFDAVSHRDIDYDGLGTEVILPVKELEIIKKRLAADGLKEHQPLVVLCPGASYINKRWLPERFGETAEALIHDLNAFIVLLGGPNDKPLCKSILSGMKHNAFSYAGELTLSGSAALLSLAAVVITNDSGMMHLAQSQKKPVIAIFGPTTRELGFFPIPGNSEVIEKQVSCRPCTTKGLNYCPKKHFNCMNLIETEEVLNATKRLLANKK